MKHFLIPAIIMALSLVPTTLFAQETNVDFSAENSDGISICYRIISEEEKTCEVIGMRQFSGEIVIPPTANGYDVVAIGYAAFSYGYVTSITLPNSVLEIKDTAFMYSELKQITFGNSVETIGEWAFSACHLNSLSLPNSLKTIGFRALTGLDISSLTIPNSVTTIGDGAFTGGDFTEVTISNSAADIGDGAFARCENLKSVTIPKSVSSIGVNPFQNCSSIESITVEEGNDNYNSEDNCNAIIETNSGTLIAGCKNTVIPNTIKVIGAYAFSNCIDLNSVTIPSTVTSIGNTSFSNCTSLSTVYSEITDFFDIDKSVFQGSENTTLYVPKGMATTYRSSRGWSVIKYIEEMPDDTPDASFLLSCSNRGSVSINGSPSITNKISAASINEGTDNTFTFTPKPNCKLDQVILNGLDITSNVEGNTLTCTIPANSQMIVTFTTEQGDINNDGTINIADVVAIVNKILSN